MEIMNYTEMLNNANLVKSLANKTIECSKDYVDSKKEDIIDQMMEYVSELMAPIIQSNIDLDPSFKRDCASMECVMFGAFGGDGTGARFQFYYKCDNTYIRAFFNEFGYWYSAKQIDDPGLKWLLDHWQEYKAQWNERITNRIKMMNSINSSRLTKQLELHEAVRNFKI